MRFLAILTFFFFMMIPAGLSLAAEANNGNMENQINDALLPVINLVSSNPWVQGLSVIAITLTISSLVTWFFFKLARKLTAKTSFTLDDQLIAILQPVVHYLLIAVGVSAGITLLPLNDGLNLLLQRAIRTITVFVWAVFFIRLCTLILNRLASLKDKYNFIQTRTVTVFDNIGKVVIFGVAIYCIFVIWNINLTAWLASAGIAGIAIGFAAKDTLSNLFSGIFIIADSPYKVGDWVVLDNVGRGKVTSIGLRSTRILTRDDIEVTVPNSIIGNTTIINQSGGPYKKMRIRLPVGVAYGSDIDKVTTILKKIAQEDPMVCKDPSPRVRFRVFGASSLDFELLFWVNRPEERGMVVDAMNTKIYQQFNKEQVEIPYTKQDIYIKGLPVASSEENTIPAEITGQKDE